MKLSNVEIARLFSELAFWLQVEGDNPFKIRAYTRAADTLKRLPKHVFEYTEEELKNISGFGKAIVEKLGQIRQSGTFQTLERYRNKYPPSLLEMAKVSGLGPGKIGTLYRDFHVQSLEDLWTCIEDGCITKVKGISSKVVPKLRESVRYLLDNRHRLRYDEGERVAKQFIDFVRSVERRGHIWTIGTLASFDNVLESLDFLTDIPTDRLQEILSGYPHLDGIKQSEEGTRVQLRDLAVPIRIRYGQTSNLGSLRVQYTSSGEFFRALVDRFGYVESPTEEDFFRQLGVPYVPVELRHNPIVLEGDHLHTLDKLVEETTLRGFVHCHSNYSDGVWPIATLMEEVRSRGFSYLVLTDHSQYARYAGGLTVEELHRQWREIDDLRRAHPDFPILKGIELDILPDGSLDYDEDLRRQFDFIIASVHSQLDMEEDQATERILRAVQSGEIHMLGHPTGRLLLLRKGYPLHYEKIFEACASNGVAIELNANPRRLDIDWRRIEEALQAGVKISINTDAHRLEDVDYFHYGIAAGRKAGLTVDDNISSWDFTAFCEHFSIKRMC